MGYIAPVNMEARIQYRNLMYRKKVDYVPLAKISSVKLNIADKQLESKTEQVYYRSTIDLKI
ncbi:hypothetical protein LC087_01785 [Bacillus carboniphilus]|uniref:Uncharacterized protein n=1 Tax=Bacillus carboniphilus TaxID=86663 RepID=A0ABY9JZB4_9BACI|nr:hypothetical protein [Bacillus carboniphilus]WLR42976.1 hypothetical protein LC087_01785 [Bacillus carboniphilus]